jgi:uncharacterized membrane protein YkvA (DUF1232 family)
MSQNHDSAPDFENPEMFTDEALSQHARVVEAGFWLKLRKVMGKLPFTQELCAAYFCAMDDETPTRVRGILLAALAYFVMPIDMIPDIVTGFGFSDDATVIATAMGIVGGHIKPSHHDKARTFLVKESPEAENEASGDNDE